MALTGHSFRKLRFYTIKDTTDAPKWANNLRLDFDDAGRLSTQLYDKRDGFGFPIYVEIFRNPLHVVFLLHSWHVMLVFVRNMNIFCSDDIFWFQSYWSRDILHGKVILLLGNYMVVIQTLFTTLSQLWHNYVTYVERI